MASVTGKRNKSITQGVAAAVLGLVAAALLLLFFFIGKTDAEPERQDIKDLRLAQNGSSIHVEWNGAGEHSVTVMGGYSGPKTYYATDDNIDVPISDAPKTYSVIVSELDKNGHTSVKNIIVDKTDQTILSKDRYVVIEGEPVKIKANAKGDLKYRVRNRSVAEIDEEGVVTGLRPGKSRLMLYAESGETYRAEAKSVDLIVYSSELDKTKLKKKESKQNAELSWEKIPYVNDYEVLKFSEAEEKYVKYKEVTGTSAKVPLEKAKYKVRGFVETEGRRLKSKRSNTVKVSSVIEKMESYDDIHTIAELDESNLELVARISGTGKYIIPQSFCYAKGEYIMTFVGNDRETGYFVSYDKDGNRVSERKADMGYVNGSTYSPDTNRIYTVLTHKSTQSREVESFDLETLEKKESELPRISSGIAYDESRGVFYTSGGPKIMVTDHEFNAGKVIMKKRHHHAQDIGAYDGACIVPVWSGGDTSYVDLYRIEDEAYLGSFDIPFGEIESATVVDRRLVILMHSARFKGEAGNFILRTKKPLGAIE